MKSKNEKSVSGNNKTTQQQTSNANKKQTPVNIDKGTATGNVKPRAGRGSQ